MRGAYRTRTSAVRMTFGEPPRARGLLIQERQQVGTCRRTPACAGPTPCRCTWSARGPENPRVRGAYRRGRGGCMCAGGEPPRARGLPCGGRRPDAEVGRTPACAGPTPPAFSLATRKEENPRVRGAYRGAGSTGHPQTGEPPRARGLREGAEQPPADVRRTPACAGPTTAQPGRRDRSGENPRVRGAYHLRPPHQGPQPGEPPRARGLLLQPPGRESRGGRTPACAGPTPSSAPRSSRSRENPRVRGAYVCRLLSTFDAMGEPPRARGLHLLAREYSASFS